MLKEISDKKQKLLDEFVNAPLIVGEKVYIKSIHVSGYESNHSEAYEILKVNKKTIIIQLQGGRTKKIDKLHVDSRLNVYRVGANPFNEKFDSVRAVNFSMDSIIHSLELAEKRRETPYEMSGIPVKEVGWNPYVYNKDGEKQYYQRGFVWSEEQNQLLIESIYKGINCGVILIRKKAWKKLEEMARNGETDLSFNDIVDGKQRLNAIKGFINGDYPDMHGNYYSDLSGFAQSKMGNHQLFQYAEMNENATDEETLFQFLKMNHEGIPQSKEHLEFVANLLKTVK